MVEAKIRVEVTSIRDKNLIGEKNPFYGNTNVKKVIEEIYEHEFDKRNDIAPCGVIVKFKTNENTEMFIKANRYVLEHESEDRYLVFFSVEEKVYELFVSFIDNEIFNVVISEWLNNGDFENGDDADNTYRLSCLGVEPYYC